MTWTNWPIAERGNPSPAGPASEMNVLFFSKWHDRDENHRARAIPGDWLSEQVAFPTLGVWTPFAAPASRIWIPPWAEALLVRCCMAINVATGPDGGGVGRARPKLGTVYGTEMQVWLQCEYEFFPNPVPGGEDIPACVADHPGADGWPGDQSLKDKQSLIEIPEAMRDTEQLFTYEVRRDANAVTYVRVFNDPRNAGDSRRHKHWLLLEAA